MSELHKKLGSRMLDFRRDAKKSRRAVKDQTGIGTTTIRELEMGQTDPRIGTLDLLCRHYGKTIGELCEPWLQQNAIKASDEELFIWLREILRKNNRQSETLRVTIENAWKTRREVK